jgi:hypothetical protein
MYSKIFLPTHFTGFLFVSNIFPPCFLVLFCFLFSWINYFSTLNLFLFSPGIWNKIISNVEKRFTEKRKKKWILNFELEMSSSCLPWVGPINTKTIATFFFPPPSLQTRNKNNNHNHNNNNKGTTPNDVVTHTLRRIDFVSYSTGWWLLSAGMDVAEQHGILVLLLFLFEKITFASPCV